jgi:hypothetical protein
VGLLGLELLIASTLELCLVKQGKHEEAKAIRRKFLSKATT